MWQRFLILCFALFLPVAVFAQEEVPVIDEEVAPVVEVVEPVGEEAPASDLTEEAPVEQPALEEESDLQEPAAPEEVTPSSAPVAVPEELIIQSEQIAWNQFRFRPASRLGAGDFQYEWDFGDGEYSSDRVAEHAYGKPGRYSVTLRLIEPDGTPHVANMMVRVGFFHLANWRLWVILGLLALIIILASVTAGVTESIVPEQDGAGPEKPTAPDAGEGGEVSLEPLAEDSGDFDSFAATGEETKALGSDLALLESIGHEQAEPEAEDVSAAESEASPSSAAEELVQFETGEAEAALAPAAPKKAVRKTTRKKTTKKRPGKKRTIKVKTET